MKDITAKVGIGPVSTEAIIAAFKYSQSINRQIMLIASKNQIDWDGGYVNNWNTEQYVECINNFR